MRFGVDRLLREPITTAGHDEARRRITRLMRQNDSLSPLFAIWSRGARRVMDDRATQR
jgi:hypothetical protein